MAADANCTGRWGYREIAEQLYWICSQCGAICTATNANHEAAVQENLMGLMLRCLAKEGRELLDKP